MIHFPRFEGRGPEALRPVTFKKDIAYFAQGSVLSCFGNTQVICAAILEKKVPRWMQQQGIEGGWVSAEYSLLPYSTPQERKVRDINKGKPDGRGIEIQRLIGRSLRAVIDVKKLAGHTLWLDCDVLQADGGTRTAAITGAYVAASMAIKKALADGRLKENPFMDSVAAVSVGVLAGETLIDLNYEEDSQAEVDFNVVMTGSGRFIEVQGGGEGATFDPSQLNEMIALAQKGIKTLTQLQLEALS